MSETPFYYARMTIVMGYYVLPLSVCPLSARLTVTPLKRKICVINSFQSFQAINLKLYTYIISILKMCMWIFADEKIILQNYAIFNFKQFLG